MQAQGRSIDVVSAGGKVSLPTQIDDRPRTFWSIQYLRGMAALAVVVFHASTGSLAPARAIGFKLGAHGVDVFFVISGFIMFTAARREPFVRFWANRAIRIYPLYWMALFTTVAIGRLTTNYGTSGRELLASALLWPFYSFGHPDKIWPILVPGWTLTYELFFYIVFSIGILSKRVISVPASILIILIIMGALTHPRAAPFVVATNPLLAEFVIGLLIGVAVHRRPMSVVSLGIAWGLATAICWATHCHAQLMINAGGIVGAGLLAEPLIERFHNRLLKLLGDASYAIYLVHSIVLSLPDILAPQVIVRRGNAGHWVIVAVMIVLSTLAGIIVHIWIERPLLKKLRPLANILTKRLAWKDARGQREASTWTPKVRLPPQIANEGIVLYFCYGREAIFEQTLYSILTLLHICEREKRGCRIVVYTDAPDRFKTLSVETVALSQTALDDWLAGSDYIHRRKTCVILDALQRFDTKVAFIDSDTWFVAHPHRIFARVGPGRAVFHICEGFVASTGTPFDDALARQLGHETLALRSGERVIFGPHTRMWNTGVIAIDPADGEKMLDALALSDAIWATADPAGAYGKKIHHAEQFAMGYAFRSARISESNDVVYHYWPTSAKEAFGAVLREVLASVLAGPTPGNVEQIYAIRPRQVGMEGMRDALKMAIRAMALKFGLRIRGVRRSVR